MLLLAVQRLHVLQLPVVHHARLLLRLLLLPQRAILRDVLEHNARASGACQGAKHLLALEVLLLAQQLLTRPLLQRLSVRVLCVK